MPKKARRRPHDRRQRILVAAADLFWRRGYHQVGMVDIAASVGITASALYRHFKGKQDLLAAVLTEALGELDVVSQPHDLNRLVGQLVTRGLERREFTALWDREKRGLADKDREAISTRIRAVEARIATALRATYPHEPPPLLALRAGAVLAVAESPSYQRVELGFDRLHDLLHSAACAVAEAAVPAADEVLITLAHGRDPQPPESRREALLGAAVRLFAERGFPQVSLADIGSATGITGPSIYNYFETKDELLSAGLDRVKEALWLTLHDALAGADGPLDALYRALRNYILFAATNPDLLSMSLIETVHLPVEHQERYRRPQQEFVAEWVALLHRARPELSQRDARVLVGACLSLPNALLRNKRLRRRPNLAGEVERFAVSVLVAPANTPATTSSPCRPVR